MEKYEKPFIDNNTPVTEEALFAMRQEMLTNPSQTQKEFDEWHQDVVLFINELYQGDKDTIQSVADAVGVDITELYRSIMVVKLGFVSEEETLKTIEEHYCSGHIH